MRTLGFRVLQNDIGTGNSQIANARRRAHVAKIDQTRDGLRRSTQIAFNKDIVIIGIIVNRLFWQCTPA